MLLPKIVAREELQGPAYNFVKISGKMGGGGSTYYSMFGNYVEYGNKRLFLYSAISGPLDRSKRVKLFAFPGRPVHSDTNSASPGIILARQQLRAKAKSLTFPPLSIARYSFYAAESTGVSMERTKMPNHRNGNKGGLYFIHNSVLITVCNVVGGFHASDGESVS